MKKINRKGFTLIELLAVIVVLAIVLVVSIPSVIRSVNSAREKSLENASTAVADWMTRQYQLMELSDSGITDDQVDENFKDLYEGLLVNNGTPAPFTLLLYSPYVVDPRELAEKEDSLLKAAGIGGGTDDVTGEAWLSDNRICVRLTPVEDKTNADGTTTESKSRFKGVAAKTSIGCE